jgi:23S rRNA (pseudouridine1915-N3)-methyltransferase
MRLAVAAVGRLKEGHERALVEHYRKRAEQLGRRIGFRGIDILEIRESRAAEVSARLAEESTAIMKLIPERAVVIALDERGKNLDSKAFAHQLRRWRDEGREQALFLIGGDDGLPPSLRTRATLTLAMGAATWPHALARVLLMEQIYRAMSILAGHPYHRG